MSMESSRGASTEDEERLPTKLRSFPGDAAGALKLYHEARVAHQHEKGSIESTALQLKRLLAVLPLEDSAKTALAHEFRLDQPPG